MLLVLQYFVSSIYIFNKLILVYYTTRAIYLKVGILRTKTNRRSVLKDMYIKKIVISYKKKL
jgi:hypothetical protein